MTKYSCECCTKEFSQKFHYDKHMNKKNSCQDNGKLTSSPLTSRRRDPSPHMPNLLEVLNKILENKSYKEIAEKLNVALGTVKRWNGLKTVPKPYCFELMRLANMDIDYSKFTFKEKDQFFTPIEIAKYCYSTFLEILNKYDDTESGYTYIEPSAGSGNFLKVLPIERRIGLDIEPKDKEIIEADYLSWSPPDLSGTAKYVVIGNPPFGLRGQLALKFINHSSRFADYVCFILPQLFESDGKGVPRKRIHTRLRLLHSEKLDTYFLEPGGKKIKIECIFQVWSKYHNNPKYNIGKINTKIMKIYSLSDGGTPSTTRNKKMFDKCDVYLPSTCFGKEKMKYYENFEVLPRRKGYGIVFHKDRAVNIRQFKEIDWSKIAFLSTNSAYNIRTSQISTLFN